MNQRIGLCILSLVFLVSPAVLALQAGPQKSGNELALNYMEAGDREKPAIAKEAIGRVMLFRYLRIVTKEETTTNGFPCVVVQATEPSSDMYITFKVVKKVSLDLIRTIAEGEAVAISGRIHTINKDTQTIFVEPVIVRYKDKLAPKLGKELMEEVDPNAIKVPK
ncbi:MAG: hypothetical protein A2498_03155 [Lentisphaerae bacterium RIFOXYC12_FULL_60_16]|nr:MAG: hypothetical protein A2498_03155 [Lentisphaerae bacterium RIFOXYC12_FULL_60_16]OGV85262.1 MAG: hypothetical protein A2340_01640 [Lentisphaerae bacterium RIFOXYB12_FULL_60_10]